MEKDTSYDLNKQSKEYPNYDEYNQNNRLVNDVNYSYYFHQKQNLENNKENNDNNINNNINENDSINNNNENDNNYLNEQNNQNININDDIKTNTTRLSTPYINFNYDTSRISSPIDIRADEQKRKKILLDNIESQMGLRRQNKLNEMEKIKQEDQKYLKEMFEYYPFGRAGGGAPIRNKKGEVVALRRNLISDKKYNHSSINVDDDYDEVWGKIKKNNKNDNKNDNINNKFSPMQRTYSTININRTNNMNNTNNRFNMQSSYDFRNYNNDLDKTIYERRLKQLQLQKEQEEIKNDELKLENTKLQHDLFYQNDLNTKKDSKNINNTLNKVKEEEYETTTDNNTNNINNNINNLDLINRYDYYDNVNFVPKSKINPRMDNNFLFSEELGRLRSDMKTQQDRLLEQISQLKDSALIAKTERNQVNKDLNLIKYELKELKRQSQIPQFINEDIVITNNTNNDHDTFVSNNLNFNLKRNENDYDYIDDLFFKKYENELPYNTQMRKEKKIFHLEKNYEDKNLIELDKLIKKSNDIMQNFKENELLEKKFKQKPEDYFDTSDYFFHTYMLEHKNDYLEYANEYKYNNRYKYNNLNNKFMEYNGYDNNNDIDVNVEKI